MKLSHIELLQCIECSGTLALIDGRTTYLDDSFIEMGALRCLRCGAIFPIIDGVGVFFRKTWISYFLNDYEKGICVSLGLMFEETMGDLPNESLMTKRVADNWSYQWNAVLPLLKHDFDKDDFNGALCFHKFILIESEEYVGKRVVVWCGGNGREAYHISRNNPQLLVVNEIGDEIYRINGLIDQSINLLLLRCDMLHNPLRGSIADISICDHALQHIVDKLGAFSVIANVLTTGGTAAVCVYSYEHNFLVTHVLEPMKSILHRMSLKAQEKAALIPAAFVFLLINFFYKPLNYFFLKSSVKKYRSLII